MDKRRSFVSWLDDRLAPYGFYAWKNRNYLLGIQFGKIGS